MDGVVPLTVKGVRSDGERPAPPRLPSASAELARTGRSRRPRQRPRGDPPRRALLLLLLLLLLLVVVGRLHAPDRRRSTRRRASPACSAAHMHHAATAPTPRSRRGLRLEGRLTAGTLDRRHGRSIAPRVTEQMVDTHRTMASVSGDPRTTIPTAPGRRWPHGARTAPTADDGTGLEPTRPAALRPRSSPCSPVWRRSRRWRDTAPARPPGRRGRTWAT